MLRTNWKSWETWTSRRHWSDWTQTENGNFDKGIENNITKFTSLVGLSIRMFYPHSSCSYSIWRKMSSIVWMDTWPNSVDNSVLHRYYFASLGLLWVRIVPRYSGGATWFLGWMYSPRRLYWSCSLYTDDLEPLEIILDNHSLLNGGQDLLEPWPRLHCFCATFTLGS